MDKTFAEKLKEARKAAGLSQQSMADKMLIPKRTIQDWEGELRTPPSYVQRFVINELAAKQATWRTVADADAVEVVRCKDCKYWTGKDYDGCCIKNGLATRYANDYCSYGERRE